MKETDVQYSICEYLAYRQHFFWRQNTIPALTRDGGFRRMPAFSKNGVPDIILIVDGKFVGLEVKAPKGKQSESQKDFEAGCKQAGGCYYIVTSIEDVKALGL